tara:strand:+ start:1046 stop:1279 length:234 start_codon:yes stop_codon:yes gene_type:complete
MEPNGEDLKKKIEELEEIKKECEKQIERIQSKCTHSNYIIKSINPEGNIIRRICTGCGKEIGYPTKEELDKYLNNEK